jgi:hypothetical protein
VPNEVRIGVWEIEARDTSTHHGVSAIKLEMKCGDDGIKRLLNGSQQN